MKKTFLLFCMAVATLAANATTYALYGTAPEGATDLTAGVTASALGSTTFAEGVFTGAGLPGRINETGNYLQLSLSAAQNMTLTDQLAVHVVLQRTAAGTGNVQVSFCNGGWNAARASWEIAAAEIGTEAAADIVLKYEDRNTGNWNSYGEGNLTGDDRAFNGEILRLSAANGEAFTISAIYVEGTFVDGDEPTEIPEQDPTRIYLRKGTAETPAGVAEVDYSAGVSLSSEYWNCDIATEFFGVTTQTPAEGDWENGWWFNFQLKSTETVDLSQVFSTWRVVVSVKNGVVEEGADRGLTVKVDGKELSFVTTIAEATSFVEHAMPLTEVLSGASHLRSLAPATTIIDFSSSNNHTGGRNVEFDYIYLTNEPESTPTAVENVVEVRAEKVIRNGQVYILRGGNLYNVAGSMVK